MIATAALAVVAGSASAQTLKADIPMSFRVGDKLMAPGAYQIRMVTGATREAIYVHNLGTHNSAVLLPGSKSDTPKTWRQDGSARVTFECLGSKCTLRRLWNGEDAFAYDFPALKPAGDIEARQTTVITLAMVKVH